MDQKKQDLNPELKSIYDKVMNTQVKPAGQAPAGVSPTTPPSAETPQAGLPAQPAQTPLPAQPAQPPMPPAPGPQQATGGPVLANAQPRPVTEPQAFVFSGNKVVSQAAPQKGGGLAAGGMSGKIIIVLVIILVAAWGALWGKIFELF